MFDDVLGYIAYMPFVSSNDDILALLKLYGRALCTNRPVVFTALLIRLCTADFAALLPPSHPSALKTGKNEGNNVNTGKNKDNLSQQQQGVPQPNRPQQVTATDIMKVFSHLISDNIVIPSERLPITEVLYLFSSDEANLLILLEGFVEASAGRLLPAKVCTTLMELYLQKYSSLSEQFRQLFLDIHATRTDKFAVEAQIQAQETHVMSILDGAHTQYDPAHALLLCYSFKFERGQRFLLERQQSSELLMRMLIQSNDVKEVFKVLRREGSKNPELYVQVLTYFVQQSVEADSNQRSAKEARRKDKKLSDVSAGNAEESDRDVEEEDDDDDDDEDEEEEEDRCYYSCVLVLTEIWML